MKIHLEDYETGWVDAFDAEKQTITLALIGFSPIVEHIGSTAVAGLCAKPTIDILVGLRNDMLLDKVIAPIIEAGYTYFKKYEPAMPYRRLFARLQALAGTAPPEAIDVNDQFVRGQSFISVANVHVMVEYTPHWTRHIAFRDFLRAHPRVRDDYGADNWRYVVSQRLQTISWERVVADVQPFLTQGADPTLLTRTNILRLLLPGDGR